MYAPREPILLYTGLAARAPTHPLNNIHDTRMPFFQFVRYPPPLEDGKDSEFQKFSIFVQVKLSACYRCSIVSKTKGTDRCVQHCKTQFRWYVVVVLRSACSSPIFSANNFAPPTTVSSSLGLSKSGSSIALR